MDFFQNFEFMSNTNNQRFEMMSSFGWSPQIQEQFFEFANQIIGNNYKGVFTIKEVKGKWFWYYQFSNTKIQPRLKYLCSCDKLGTHKTSFQHATQVLIEKINHNFSNKDVIEPLLSKYITEYIKLI